MAKQNKSRKNNAKQVTARHSKAKEHKQGKARQDRAKQVSKTEKTRQSKVTAKWQSDEANCDDPTTLVKCCDENVQDPDEKQKPRGDVNLHHYPDEKCENTKNEEIPGSKSCVIYPEGSS